jgi:DNA polymerase-3 subunit delta
MVERGLARLRARVAGTADARAVRVVWGDDEPARLQGVLADLVSPSLFGGTDLLVIRRAEALASAVEDELQAIVPRLDERARLVLVAKALDQRRRLHAAWAKAGAAIGFTRPDPRAAAAWVGALARERGHAIAPGAVERLLERTGPDLSRIDDELEKLSLLVGPKVGIDADHVDAYVPATRAHAIEELTDRLARHDLAGAVRTLRGLVAAGEPPLRIIAFVASNLRRALHVSELLASGMSEAEVAGRLGLPPWLVARQSNRGSAATLESALGSLAELDLALKSSRPDVATFEATILAIVGRRRTGGPARGQPLRA